MYNILIVEDEQIERETLVHIIKNEFHMCNRIFVAKNGIEALEVFDKDHIDIILTDINIPGINGLEVIRKVKEKAPETQFLILSSYNYFEYAQEAIRLGVEDFILKPYNIAHLKESLQNVIEQVSEKNKVIRDRSELLDKIEKITPVVENECLYAIVSNENELVLRKSLRLLSQKIRSGFCFILRSDEYREPYVKAIKKGFQQLGFRCIQDLFHGLVIFFVMGEQAIEKEDIHELVMYMKEIQTSGYDYGVGPIVNDISEFHHSFMIARDRIHEDCEDIEEALISDHTTIDKERFQVQKIANKFLDIFSKMDEEGLKNAISQLSLQLILEEKSQISMDVETLFACLKKEIIIRYPQITFMEPIQPLQITRNIHQEVPLYLHLQMHKLYDPIVEERFKNTNSLVKQAIKYIDSNYRKQITLSDMADSLQVSPYYISKLLSTSMNKTFTELVSERRVEASKELLKTNKRIKEIAFEVGFQGQNYFTKVFKNYTGVTPKIYKNTFENKN